ncbi:hypothetical protein [Actinacidiphila glaucinigra]|uniref:Uncharacterized protein n=1 Tax=Actinacidiphila glaucinigra TaxID=235986 RepID=A0A239MRM4_9ACTN|nr:hypothetical protein [Actinacidiphila glaucinigra]SNT44499.1 hypothetical protein SAMN05216252_12624 [Actinacidiphila glaucinigra]
MDNRAVDDQRLSVLDIGLLTMALRLPDGADFTIAALAQTRKPGREALTKAMRNLVNCGYIVKLKIQDAADGTWRTEFSVAGLPHQHADIHHLLNHVTGTRAIRVEPAWLDPRNHHTPAPATTPLKETLPEPAATDSPAAQSALHPVTTGPPDPAATSDDSEDVQAGPSNGFPAVGEPTVGDPAIGEPAAGHPTAGNPSAKELRLNKQDRKNSSLSSPPTTPRPPTTPAPKRETTTPSGHTPPAGPPPTTPSRSGPTGNTPGNAGTSAPAPAQPAPGSPQAAAPARHGHTPGTPNPAAPAPARSAPAQPRAAAAARIADAWTTARHHHGHPVPALAPGRIAHTAEALLNAGIQEQHLTQAATAMARKPTWYDLKRHLQHWTPPTTPQPATRPAHPTHCGACDHGWTTDPDGRARKCPCRTQQHP